MSTSFELSAAARTETGSAAARRMRHAGETPGIIYGGGDDPVMISVKHNEIFHSLENEAFHSSIISLNVDGKKQKAILRDYEMHPFKPVVMHLDFQRISAKEKISISVPLHSLNAEECPGVKLNHGVATHNLTEVEVISLPADIPEFLEIDLIDLDVGDSAHLSDIKLPEGVEIVALANDGEDLAAVTIVGVRASQGEGVAAAAADEAAEAAEEAESAEAAEGEAEAPAEE